MAYYTTDKFEERNDLTLNSTDFPTTSLVQEWIDESTEDINSELNRDFDVDDYEDLLPITQTSDVLFVNNPPINTLTQVYYNSSYNPIETPVWEEIDSVIMDSNGGVVKVNDTQPFRVGSVFKVSYNGGYSEVPVNVQKLCRLLVQREYINTQLQQEIGDSTLTSIASIRVSEKGANGMKLQLERLDKDIENAWAKLKNNSYVGTYQGMY